MPDSLTKAGERSTSRRACFGQAAVGQGAAAVRGDLFAEVFVGCQCSAFVRVVGGLSFVALSDLPSVFLP